MVERIAFILLLLFVGFSCIYSKREANDPLDANGKIEIIWDIADWTDRGYVATVSIKNNQPYRHIVENPGWKLGWTWQKKEVIWWVKGAIAEGRGDCSDYLKGQEPLSCMPSPTILDITPGEANVVNCCKSGVLTSPVLDPTNSMSMFTMEVGFPGAYKNTADYNNITNHKNSTKAPTNFVLGAPGPGYTCEEAKRVYPPSKFWMREDKRRYIDAYMTWSVTCEYSQRLSQNPYTCCVTLSSFYSEKIAYCPNCACGCKDDPHNAGKCTEPDSTELRRALLSSSLESYSNRSLVECTNHLCPIRVHWHIKTNYRGYWRVKVTITNLNYVKNYSYWNLVMTHQNLGSLTQVYSLNYHPLINHGKLNDTGMLWGLESSSDMLMSNGPSGNIQTEMLFKKDKNFTFKNNWAFPQSMAFNGDYCVFPTLDEYPHLPNASTTIVASSLNLFVVLVFLLVLLGYVQDVTCKSE